jgi:PST family polysaccharide transporter
MAPHREIVRSTLLLGSGALVTAAIGVVRLKAVALMLGPAGLGLLALLLNIVSVAAVVAGAGLNGSGVRQLAAAQGQGKDEDLAAAWRAILLETIVLALAGTLAIWLLRRPIAEHIIQRPDLAGEVGWLAPAVGLTVLSVTAVTLLNGYRRNADLAWSQILGAAAGTAGGLLALKLWGEDGLIAYVLLAPGSALLAGAIYAMRIPRPGGRPRRPIVGKQARELLRLGLPYMLSGLAMNLALLATRSLVNDRLGAIELGLFSAVWIISVTYVNVAVQAMSVDFLPHFSGVSHDPERSAEVLSAQIETALLLASPLFLLAAASAPWLLELAYSSAFTPAAELLRWQVLGDVLKLVSWPLTVAMLASGRGKIFLATEAGASLFFVAFIWLSIEKLGLIAPGVAYLAMYAVHSTLLLMLAARFLNFRLSRGLAALLAAVLAATTGVSLLAANYPGAGLAAGLVAAAAALGLAVLRLHRIGALPARVERLLARIAPGA